MTTASTCRLLSEVIRRRSTWCILRQMSLTCGVDCQHATDYNDRRHIRVIRIGLPVGARWRHWWRDANHVTGCVRDDVAVTALMSCWRHELMQFVILMVSGGNGMTRCLDKWKPDDVDTLPIDFVRWQCQSSLTPCQSVLIQRVA